jgi:hypothetical protein
MLWLSPFASSSSPYPSIDTTSPNLARCIKQLPLFRPRSFSSACLAGTFSQHLLYAQTPTPGQFSAECGLALGVLALLGKDSLERAVDLSLQGSPRALARSACLQITVRVKCVLPLDHANCLHRQMWRATYAPSASGSRCHACLSMWHYQFTSSYFSFSLSSGSMSADYFQQHSSFTSIPWGLLV